MSSLSFIASYLHESAELSLKLKEQEVQIEQAIDAIFKAWLAGAPVFIIGNGGSASTATHFAADLVKTVINNPDQRGVKALALVDNIPLVSASTNDWGWGEAYTAALQAYWQEGGIVIGFSVHGGSGGEAGGIWSQNLLKAMQYAKDHRGTAIGFSGFDGGAMKNLSDISVIAEVNSTPLVESFHVVLFHLITFRLKEMIADFYTKGSNK